MTLPEGVRQYNAKTGFDPLNQLPILMGDYAVPDETKFDPVDFLSKHYVAHHFGIGSVVGDVNLDSYVSTHDIARELYTQELEQTRLLLREILKARNTSLKNDTVVIDVGSGSGITSFMLAEGYSPRIYGVNLARKQVDLTNRVALKRGIASHVTFHHMNMNDMSPLLQIKDFHLADVVIQNESDMYTDNLDSMFRSIVSIMRKGGLYANLTWCKSDNHVKNNNHAEVINKFYATGMWSHNKLQNTMERQGFNVRYVLDLTPRAITYFLLRLKMKGSVGGTRVGIIEPAFLNGYKEGVLKYLLFIAQLRE